MTSGWSKQDCSPLFDHGYLSTFDKNGIQVIKLLSKMVRLITTCTLVSPDKQLCRDLTNQWGLSTLNKLLKQRQVDHHGKWILLLTKMVSNTKARLLRSGKYYDGNGGQLRTASLAKSSFNVWAYFGADGYAVEQANGQHLYWTNRCC